MLWGHPVPDPVRWVILSRNLPEFLGRFMPHLLATVFYYPLLFSLKLRSANLRFVLSVASVILWVACGAWAKKQFSHWPRRGMIESRMWGAVHFVSTYVVFSNVYYFHVE